MAFRFSLATVLRVRVLREELEERELRNILLDMTRTSQSALHIKGELGRVRSAMGSAAAVYGRELHLSMQDVKQIEACLRELEQQIEKLEQLKEVQLGRYQSARQARELLEEICKKQQADYVLDAAKKEQRVADDAFLARRRLR